MKVSSIEQVNRMDCCGCEWPTCPDPAKECQSFAVLACGTELPVSDLVPESDKCIYYKTRTATITTTDTYSGPSGEGFSTGGTMVEAYQCVIGYQYSGEDPDIRSCEALELSTEYSIEGDLTYYEDGDWYERTITSGASSSSIEEPCSGSLSITTLYPGDPQPPDVSPITLCPCTPPLDVSMENVIYEDGSFSLTVGTVDGEHASLVVQTLVYSDPVILSDLVTEGEARAELYGEDDWPGSSCVSAIAYVHGDSPSDPPLCTQVASIIYSRYRWTVPPEWIGTRSVLDLTWDEIFFPEVWDEWDQKVEIYEAWEAAYAAWVAGGSVGPEPVEPEEPGPEPEDKPELVENRDWTWDGVDEQSEWFVMGFPPDPGVPGEIRTVNLAVNCWSSTRLGRKPTWHGEIYRLPETP